MKVWLYNLLSYGIQSNTVYSKLQPPWQVTSIEITKVSMKWDPPRLRTNGVENWANRHYEKVGMKDDLLCWINWHRGSKYWMLVVPASARETVIHSCHSSLWVGRPCVERNLARVRLQYLGSNMARGVEDSVKGCQSYAGRKTLARLTVRSIHRKLLNVQVRRFMSEPFMTIYK